MFSKTLVKPLVMMMIVNKMLFNEMRYIILKNWT